MIKIDDVTITPKRMPGYFTQAFAGDSIIADGNFTIITGVKNDETLTFMELDGFELIADNGSCAWEPTDAVKLSEAKAVIKTFKVQLQDCINKFEGKFMVESMSEGAWNTMSDISELTQGALALISKKISKMVGKMIFQGAKDQNDIEFDGMELQLVKATKSGQVKGEDLTQANVLEKVAKVYRMMKQEVLDDPDASLRFYMTQADITKARLALADVKSMVIKTAWSVDTQMNEKAQVKYLDIPLVPAQVSKSTIIFADKRNTLLLTDMLSDIEKLRVGTMAAPKDNMFFVDGRFRLGMGIPYTNECVIYHKDVTADREPKESSENMNPDNGAGGAGRMLNIAPDITAYDLLGIEDKETSIAEALPNLTDSQVAYLLAFEESKKKPRKGVTDLLTAEIEKRKEGK